MSKSTQPKSKQVNPNTPIKIKRKGHSTFHTKSGLKITAHDSEVALFSPTGTLIKQVKLPKNRDQVQIKGGRHPTLKVVTPTAKKKPRNNVTQLQPKTQQPDKRARKKERKMKVA